MVARHLAAARAGHRTLSRVSPGHVTGALLMRMRTAKEKACMTPEQRSALIDILAKGEEISPEWSRILFPPEAGVRTRLLWKGS
jgi:hypothetical protein